MNTKVLVAVVCTTVFLTACWDNDDDTVAAAPGVTEAVPAAVVTSPTAATQYVADLTAVAAAQTDSLEPVNPIPDTLATDDTAEPRQVE